MSTRFRAVAANLSTGNNQNYDAGEGIRILQGIHPDLIFMQEMNYVDNSSFSMRSLADQVCGQTCAYYRGTGSIPNGIISAYPILASGRWVDTQVTDRDFVWARIDVPGAIDLWAVSVHFLTPSAGVRNSEATALVSLLQSNVPTSDYLLIGGDLNTATRGESAITTLAARVVTSGPYPADANTNSNTNAPRNRPYDWLLASSAFAARETPVSIGAAMFAPGLVVDTRVYTPITDLAPALASDSAASGMQHMAVVRDFLLE